MTTAVRTNMISPGELNSLFDAFVLNIEEFTRRDAGLNVGCLLVMPALHAHLATLPLSPSVDVSEMSHGIDEGVKFYLLGNIACAHLVVHPGGKTMSFEIEDIGEGSEALKFQGQAFKLKSKMSCSEHVIGTIIELLEGVRWT